MNSGESGVVGLMFLALVVWLVVLSLLCTDARNDADLLRAQLDGLHARIYELECRHVLLENYETEHEAGEEAFGCLNP